MEAKMPFFFKFLNQSKDKSVSKSGDVLANIYHVI